MDRIVPCIILIDDDLATNVYNELIIDEVGCAQKVIVHDSAEEALTYLESTSVENSSAHPNLILLDINMPRMNGWEFLEAFGESLETQLAGNIIIMLSTTSDKQEYERAINDPILKGIKSKPLTPENLEEILDIYYHHSKTVQ